MKDMRCSFSYAGQHGDIQFIVDENGRTSVTNDAEAVLAYIKKTQGKDTRVVYRDSQGDWAEIVWQVNWMGETIGFLPWHGLEWDILKS